MQGRAVPNISPGQIFFGICAPWVIIVVVVYVFYYLAPLQNDYPDVTMYAVHFWGQKLKERKMLLESL